MPVDAPAGVNADSGCSSNYQAEAPPTAERSYRVEGIAVHEGLRKLAVSLLKRHRFTRFRRRAGKVPVQLSCLNCPHEAVTSRFQRTEIDTSCRAADRHLGIARRRCRVRRVVDNQSINRAVSRTAETLFDSKSQVACRQASPSHFGRTRRTFEGRWLVPDRWVQTQGERLVGEGMWTDQSLEDGQSKIEQATTSDAAVVRRRLLMHKERSSSGQQHLSQKVAAIGSQVTVVETMFQKAAGEQQSGTILCCAEIAGGQPPEFRRKCALAASGRQWRWRAYRSLHRRWPVRWLVMDNWRCATCRRTLRRRVAHRRVVHRPGPPATGPGPPPCWSGR